MVSFCQPGNRFRIAEFFMFLYKSDHIAGFTAAKTFVNPFGRGDRERGCFFVMKRTIPQKVDTSFFKFNKTANHINYVGSIIHFLNGSF